MSDHNEPVPGETARPKLNIGFMALEPRFAEEVNFLRPDRGFDLSDGDLVFLSSRRFFLQSAPGMALGDLN